TGAMLLVELSRIFECALGMTTSKKKGIPLKVRIAPDFPETVVSDVKRLRQVLINLVGNAIKFTESGQIELLLSYSYHADTKGQINAKFEVVDTGRGIAESELESIFYAFQQSSLKASEGTGLGLAISARLVKMLKGNLTVTSSLGKGSTFAFEIPLEVSVVSLQHDTDKSYNVSSIVGEKQLCILVVDDILDNRESLGALLTSVGFVCIYATDGLEALDKVEKELPDLVFMDIKMPNMSGEEAMQEITKLELKKPIPIIALTAGEYNDGGSYLKQLGFSAYLRKPFIAKDIFAVAKQFLSLEYELEEDSSLLDSENKSIGSLLEDIVAMVQQLDIKLAKKLYASIHAQDKNKITEVLESIHFQEEKYDQAKLVLKEKVNSYQFNFLLEVTQKLAFLEDS
ncbi:MAG: ATP-binding protein, partial [Spirochaetota bacterium]